MCIQKEAEGLVQRREKSSEGLVQTLPTFKCFQNSGSRISPEFKQCKFVREGCFWPSVKHIGLSILIPVCAGIQVKVGYFGPTLGGKMARVKGRWKSIFLTNQLASRFLFQSTTHPLGIIDSAGPFIPPGWNCNTFPQVTVTELLTESCAGYDPSNQPVGLCGSKCMSRTCRPSVLVGFQGTCGKWEMSV